MNTSGSTPKGFAWASRLAPLAAIALALPLVTSEGKAQAPRFGEAKTAQGRIQSLTTAPMGEVDGAVLDDGTVIERHMGHGELNGEEIPLPTCTSYEIVDGKIHSVQVHSAVQHDVDRLMWGRVPLKDIPARLA